MEDFTQIEVISSFTEINKRKFNNMKGILEYLDSVGNCIVVSNNIVFKYLMCSSARQNGRLSSSSYISLKVNWWKRLFKNASPSMIYKQLFTLHLNISVLHNTCIFVGQISRSSVSKKKQNLFLEVRRKEWLHASVWVRGWPALAGNLA